MRSFEVSHTYDMSLQSVEGIDSAVFNACEVELRSAASDCEDDGGDDGGFDCAGTVGSAGTVGGSLGTFGTFGCCC